VGEAIAAGAVLVVVERARAPRDEGVDVVEVDDTIAALGAMARDHLSRWRSARSGTRVVAVTGSAGKTTTKELCGALLASAGSCHATRGNLNNLVGVPCVIFGIESHHTFAVLEMGMSERGEIASLGSMVEPDVGVVTNVSLAHAGGVGGSIADVAHEKGALFESIRNSGVAVANADDAAVMGQLTRSTSKRCVTFGTKASADYRLEARRALDANRSIITVRRPGCRVIEVPIQFVGEVGAVDCVAALAAAEAASGLTLEEDRIREAVCAVRPIDGRLRVRRLQSGIVVIDDSYNANPASVRAALGTLSELGHGRRIAVLGEMKELGPAADDAHDALGVEVARAGVAVLVSCGGLAARIADSASRLGVSVITVSDAVQAAEALLGMVERYDTVLVKASRSVGAERVVNALLSAYPEEPS